jgi:hypothetical protein
MCAIDGFVVLCVCHMLAFSLFERTILSHSWSLLAKHHVHQLRDVGSGRPQFEIMCEQQKWCFLLGVRDYPSKTLASSTAM